MARKRQIDPAIWVSEQFTNLPDPWARLLFIGIFNNADDDGRLKASPAYLKMIIFPRESFGSEKVLEWRKQIRAQGLIQIYTNGNDPTEYLFLPTWEKHQYISRRMPSRLPIPPEQLPNHSRIPPEPLPHPHTQYEVGTEVEVGYGTEVEVEVGKQQQTFEDYSLQLRAEYSDIDWDFELRKFHLYWSEGNRKLKRPKVALLNWMNRARARKPTEETARTHRPGQVSTDEEREEWLK